MFSLEEYNYILPEDQIAQDAIHPHHDAKLIVVEKKNGSIIWESTFWNLDQYIPDNRVIFFNNSRVIPARIPLKDKKIIREDGSEWVITSWEILFYKKWRDNQFEALVRPGSKFKKHTKIYFPEWYLEVKEITESGRLMEASDVNIFSLMEKYWELPLPPYIKYNEEKEKDYQTVFAEKNGSVAAPTASLHFTRELLEKLENEKYYISLHVGLWTFKWIDVDDIREYKIHGETIEVPKNIFSTIALLKNWGKKIVAVWTTVCRTLESLPYLWKALDLEQRQGYNISVQNFWDSLLIQEESYISNISVHESSYYFETQIYIFPGKSFFITDDLITNFHLPKSSLLVLVSAFLGKEITQKIYTYVIRNNYRFFSFWDGMYIRSDDEGMERK